MLQLLAHMNYFRMKKWVALKETLNPSKLDLKIGTLDFTKKL